MKFRQLRSFLFTAKFIILIKKQFGTMYTIKTDAIVH